jgi:predicted enzyme related to lactoylglutathione lyase
MSNSNFKISKITIAITNINEMVGFYKIVFKCDFKELSLGGSKLFSGELFGLKILLCPNDLAGVIAQQNRQQFDIKVNDAKKILEDVIKANGKIKEPYNSETKTASVIDPDGNTIVFIENNQ